MRLRNSAAPASLVVSTLALVVALSGGAAVAGGLITTKQIKNDAVTSAKVKDGTLTLKDFKASERQKLVGPAGSSASIDTVTVEGPTVSVPAGELQCIYAQCPAGKKVTGGGYYSSIAIAVSSNPADSQGLHGSGPGDTEWGVMIDNDSSIPVEVNAWAVCV